jgi:uroporphyrinogen-III decarboxylase
MLHALNGGRGAPIPVTPHWWGLFKFQSAGVIAGYADEERAWAMTGADLAAVDSGFYHRFLPDMLHLTTGAVTPNTAAAEREARRKREIAGLLPSLRKLDSRGLIDEFCALVSPSKEEILSQGIFEHVRILARELGSEVFIAVNEGNPICTVLDPGGWLGFEQGLVLMTERPDNFAFLLNGLYEGLRPRMEALCECGCDGYIGSETYCSPDLISPAMYRSLVFPAQSRLYRDVAALGLAPITYFLGNVMPLLPDILELGARGLMVEEPKKGYPLDAVELARRIEGRMCLFGNLDSIWCLLRGSVEDVRRETRRQLEAARFGPFIMASGSPVAFDTPATNIAAMMSTTRESAGAQSTVDSYSSPS